MLASANLEENRPLLVLTALEDTWGTTQPLLFLGEWCKRYERRDMWSKRANRTVPFHWDDRRKLREDYDYLESLHKRLLSSLSQSLNELHGVSYDERYWQIQLDPWLMSYLGVMFDRWECLRVAFLENTDCELFHIRETTEFPAPYSYSEFVQDAAYSDMWNQRVYQKIISTQYLDKVRLVPVSRNLIESNHEHPAVISESRLKLKNVVSNVLRLLGKFHHPDVVFLGATFAPVALVRLNIALGQFPSLKFLHALPAATVTNSWPNETELRSAVQLAFHENSDFERFIKSVLVSDLPRCVLEGYSMLRKHANTIPIRPRAIVTGSSHWDDASAKTWIAEKSASGTAFIVLEHGGSLPPYKELFDFEPAISDVRVSWFTPYHRKHVQLPPPRMAGRYGTVFQIRRLLSPKKYCSLIANENSLWVHRAHFYPMAYQWSDSFSMVLKLFDKLNADVRDHFRIKPYPVSQGWKTAQRFADELGMEALHTERSLERVYAMSKVIVCSYPETTFSEAMASSVPTILMFPERFYELNPIANPLLEILRRAKIAFNDPGEAASHLNTIWQNTDAWWMSHETVFARKEFYRQALNLDRRWLSKWTEFLATVSKLERNTVK